VQTKLRLPRPPHRIECIDISHTGGTDTVAAITALLDGSPDRKRYKSFHLRKVQGGDDFAAMREVLTRRLKRAGEAGWELPDLLVVDGGKGQLAVAERVVRELGLEDEIPVASLAKRFEEVYVPGHDEPMNVPRGSEALFMLQRVRDEAHRFANTFHRELRGKRMTASGLDGIPGLGEARKKRLVSALGGVTAVKKASLEDLKALSFLPDAVATAVHDRFHKPAPRRPSASADLRGDFRPEPLVPVALRRTVPAEGGAEEDELLAAERADLSDLLGDLSGRPDE